MLTKIIIRNFKSFEEVEIPLDNGILFVGPNNSGKTSALQALSLWYVGLRRWAEKRYDPESGVGKPLKHTGVAIGRLDLIPLPIESMDLIWRNRKVRKDLNQNIRIELIVEGSGAKGHWKCGLEYDYSNAQTLYCRPLRLDSAGKARMRMPPEAMEVGLAYLPPMSGLVSEEALIQQGRIDVLIGQGQTAEVLRNLCYRVFENEPEDWRRLVDTMEKMFGVTLGEPRHLSARGVIAIDYRDTRRGAQLDLPSSGRGMQQVLLLLAYLYSNPSGTVLLLDEPDAHLEILRQRQVYDRLIEVAHGRGSQIIAASHSEVLLNRAADSAVVAFIPDDEIDGEIGEKLDAIMRVATAHA